MTRTEELNAILTATVKEMFEDFVHSDEFAQKIQEKVGVYGKVTANLQLSSVEGCTNVVPVRHIEDSGMKTSNQTASNPTVEEKERVGVCGKVIARYKKSGREVIKK